MEEGDIDEKANVPKKFNVLGNLIFSVFQMEQPAKADPSIAVKLTNWKILILFRLVHPLKAKILYPQWIQEVVLFLKTIDFRMNYLVECCLVFPL